MLVRAMDALGELGETGFDPLHGASWFRGSREARGQFERFRPSRFSCKMGRRRIASDPKSTARVPDPSSTRDPGACGRIAPRTLMEQAKSILSRVFQQAPAPFLDELDLIRGFWPEVVGPLLATRSRLIELDAGRLVVQVPDRRWLEQFVPMRRQIMRFLEQELGKPDVREIEFVLPEGHE